MSFQEMTKEELQIKLAELQKQYDSLKQNNDNHTDFYKSVLATSPTGFVEISLQGDILSSNEAYAELTGYTQEELSTMKISEIEANQSPETIKRHTEQLLETKHARFETKHRKKDGTILEVEVKTQYLPNYKRIICFISDITECNKTQAALKESEFQYRLLINTSPTGIALVDKDGNYLIANNTIAAIWGKTPKEIVNKNIRDIAAPEVVEPALKIIQEVAESAKPFELKRYVPPLNRHFTEVVHPLYNTKNQFIGVQVIVNDITDEVNAKEEIIIAKQEAEIKELKYRKLTENIPGMVYRGKRDWTYDIVSNSEAICGYTAQEFLDGKISWLDLILPDDIDYVLSHAARLFKYPASEVHEYRIKAKDNSIRYISDHLSTVFDENNQLESVEGIVFDITERKRDEQILQERNEELKAAKEKAEESDRLKSSFLANMSHDIRTPLNSIVGFSQLIAENASSREMKRYSDIIQSQNTLLLKLVDDIMDLAKIEAGIMKIQHSTFNIHVTLDKLTSIFQEECKKQNIKLIQYSNHDKLFLYSDEQRIEQIFYNLITNALKFTKQGEIKFGYKLNGNDRLLCFVEDTGIGIPEDKQQEIFSRFTKLNEFMQGTGLGLSIVKNIVRLLGGKIWFISTPEKGTTFFFELPLHQSDEKDSSEEYSHQDLDK